MTKFMGHPIGQVNHEHTFNSKVEFVQNRLQVLGYIKELNEVTRAVATIIVNKLPVESRSAFFEKDFYDAAR